MIEMNTGTVCSRARCPTNSGYSRLSMKPITTAPQIVRITALPTSPDSAKIDRRRDPDDERAEDRNDGEHAHDHAPQQAARVSRATRT